MPSLPDVSWATTLRSPLGETRWQPRYLLTRPYWCCQALIFGRQRRGASCVLGTTLGAWVTLILKAIHEFRPPAQPGQRRTTRRDATRSASLRLLDPGPRP